ncbi:MAG: flagellar motor protein MotB [Phycisphaerales bacterium]|nr:MAG: OmpA family protein [Phycisphaerales bacterium]
MSDHEEHHEESHGGGGGHGGGHGGGAHEEHEGAPEWLISFADNVALLMGFFVILLAMNMAPKTAGPMGGEGEGGGSSDTRMVDFVIALRQGFNRPFDLSSRKAEDQPFIRRILERTGGLGQAVGPVGQHQEVSGNERGDKRKVAVTVPFDDNSTEIRASSVVELEDAARFLRDQGWIIDVRGNSSPFETDSFDEAMQLCKDRAMAVVEFLMDRGVKRNNIRVILAADNDRIVPKAYDREDARANQRVEVVLTNEAIAPDPHAAFSGE